MKNTGRSIVSTLTRRKLGCIAIKYSETERKIGVSQNRQDISPGFTVAEHGRKYARWHEKQ